MKTPEATNNAFSVIRHTPFVSHSRTAAVLIRALQTFSVLNKWRSFFRALCSWALELPTEQPSWRA
ncbi:MAG TPA: hypothetical protein VIT88_00620, partial [Pyrinomonadaceae bacterium]